MGNRKKYDVNNARLPEFTKRFRKEVDARGGVSKVSEITGISRPTINFWYNGERTPDAESLITLSQKLGVSSDWLLGLLPDDNLSNDEKLRMISECTGLSNASVNMLGKVCTIAFGQETVDTLISNPLFYQFTSYLSTYFFGTWVEEFTGKTEGHISSLRKIDDKKIFSLYIQPAMIARMNEVLMQIKQQLEKGSVENGKH